MRRFSRATTRYNVTWRPARAAGKKAVLDEEARRAARTRMHGRAPPPQPAPPVAVTAITSPLLDTATRLALVAGQLGVISFPVPRAIACPSCSRKMRPKAAAAAAAAIGSNGHWFLCTACKCHFQATRRMQTARGLLSEDFVWLCKPELRRALDDFYDEDCFANKHRDVILAHLVHRRPELVWNAMMYYGGGGGDYRLAIGKARSYLG